MARSRDPFERAWRNSAHYAYRDAIQDMRVAFIVLSSGRAALDWTNQTRRTHGHSRGVWNYDQTARIIENDHCLGLTRER